MRFRRIVGGVQVLTLVVVAVAVVSLLVRQPPDPAATRPAPGSAGAGVVALDGAALYRANCAGCHGEAGEGTYAPVLAGGAAATRGGPDEQVAFVLAGAGDMRGFAGRLTPEEVRAIVDHVATLP